MIGYQEIVDVLGLEPIPHEGGWFKRVYTGLVNQEGRPVTTSIYALFTPEHFSALHRLDADEIFFFHSGDPFKVLELLPNGEGRRIVVGNDVLKNEVSQFVFEKGSWFGGSPQDGGSHGYTLLSCVVTPGFLYEGFELGNRNSLKNRYPNLEKEIFRLTR